MTRVGYTGGTTAQPTYRSIGDHTESIQIEFDPSQISFEYLLQVFWSLHDATEQQTTQYRSAIFVHNEKQRQTARDFLKKKQDVEEHRVLTKVEDASQFHTAESYHQKYRLQESRPLMQYFRHMSNKQFMDSFVAAKMNGFAGGYSNAKDVKKMLTYYMLSHPDDMELVNTLLTYFN